NVPYGQNSCLKLQKGKPLNIPKQGAPYKGYGRSFSDCAAAAEGAFCCLLACQIAVRITWVKLKAANEPNPPRKPKATAPTTIFAQPSLVAERNPHVPPATLPASTPAEVTMMTGNPSEIFFARSDSGAKFPRSSSASIRLGGSGHPS